MLTTINRLWSMSKMMYGSARSTLQAATYTPESAIIFLTYRCTSRCTTCNIWQRPEELERELTWAEWRPVMEQLAASRLKSVELFGGDALLRKELLFEMIRFCTQHGIRTYFPTNSNGLTEATVRALIDAGLHTIYLSIDEVPEIEGQIRGVTRHYERVEKAIECIQRVRAASSTPRIECITTVSATNFRYVPKLLDFSARRFVNAHHIRGLSEFPSAALDASVINGVRPEPYFQSSTNESHRFSEEDARALFDMVTTIRRRRKQYAPMQIILETLEGLDPEHIQQGRYLDHACQFAASHVVLSPFGEVLPCLYYNKHVLGNVTEQLLGNIWGNADHRRFCGAQRAKQLAICQFCSIKSVHLPFGMEVRRQLSRTVERFRAPA